MNSAGILEAVREVERSTSRSSTSSLAPIARPAEKQH